MCHLLPFPFLGCKFNFVDLLLHLKGLSRKIELGYRRYTVYWWNINRRWIFDVCSNLSVASLSYILDFRFQQSYSIAKWLPLCMLTGQPSCKSVDRLTNWMRVTNPFSHYLFHVFRLTAIRNMRHPQKVNQPRQNEDDFNVCVCVCFAEQFPLNNSKQCCEGNIPHFSL
jgi:hypothetical protein